MGTWLYSIIKLHKHAFDLFEHHDLPIRHKNGFEILQLKSFFVGRLQ